MDGATATFPKDVEELRTALSAVGLGAVQVSSGPLDWRDPAEDMTAVRAMLDGADALVVRKVTKLTPKEVSDPDHEWVISTSGMKRDNCILELDGLDITNYRKAPYVFFVHDYRKYPIGLTTELIQEPNEWRAKLRYAPTAMAQEVKMLADAGFLRSASIAWKPIETVPIREKKKITTSVGEQEVDQFVGWRYVKSEMLEWSVVPLGADADAVRPLTERFANMLTEARARGLACPSLEEVFARASRPGLEETANEFRYRLRDPGDFQQDSFRRITLKATRKRIYGIVGRLKGEQKTTLQSVRFPKGDGWTKAEAQKWCDDHPDLGREVGEAVDAALREYGPLLSSAIRLHLYDEDGEIDPAAASPDADVAAAEDRGVVAYAATATMNEGQGWDGAAAEGRVRRWAGGPAKDAIDVSKYRRAFLWFDAAKANDLTAYKAIHHDVAGGDLRTHWRGTVAAMVVLLGGRGGLDIPSGDRRAAYDHLAKHYGQFKKAPPDFRWVEGEVLRDIPEDVVHAIERGMTKGDETLLRVVAEGRTSYTFTLDVSAEDRTITVVDAETQERLGPVAMTEELRDVLFGPERLGAVLNKRNKERLAQAATLIKDVLDSATPADESGEGKGDGKPAAAAQPPASPSAPAADPNGFVLELADAPAAAPAAAAGDAPTRDVDAQIDESMRRVVQDTVRQKFGL